MGSTDCWGIGRLVDWYRLVNSQANQNKLQNKRFFFQRPIENSDSFQTDIFLKIRTAQIKFWYNLLFAFSDRIGREAGPFICFVDSSVDVSLRLLLPLLDHQFSAQRVVRHDGNLSFHWDGRQQKRLATTTGDIWSHFKLKILESSHKYCWFQWWSGSRLMWSLWDQGKWKENDNNISQSNQYVSSYKIVHKETDWWHY